MAAIPRHSLLAIVATTLLVLGILRATIFVANDPVLGYGDQSGLHRVTGCIGITPVAPASKPGSLPRPSTTYVESSFDLDECYPSSAALIAAPVVIAYAVASIASEDPEILIPLRAFGVFNLMLFAALAIAIAVGLKEHAVAQAIHAAIFFFLIADPVSTLWFDTLYTEPALLLGVYGTVAATAVILLQRDSCRFFWWLLGASLVMLGLSREQFGDLPLVLAAIAAPALMRRSGRRARMFLVIAVILAVAQLAITPLRPEDVGPTNRVNTYLGVILPSSRDEAATLENLDLPARCATMVGATWTARRGEDLAAVCPEVTHLSSFAFARLVPTEPLTLLRAVSRVLPAAQAIVPGYLAISPETTIVSVQDLPPEAMSFIALGSRVPSIVFATAVVGMLLAFPAFLLWLLWTVRAEPDATTLPTVFLMLIAIGGYSLATTAFGEGIFGAERHNWVGALSMLAAVALLPIVMWQLTTDLLRARLALAVAFGVTLLTAGWLLWSQAQPMSIGSLESISEREGNTLEIGGFALDPWGVRRVFATVGGGPETEGTRGVERRDIEAIYPGYPEAIGAGYQIAIPPNKWRDRQELRIYVESRTSAVTEIDRRTIRVRP
ncbi:MAG TPA: hypothetical protein VKR38_00520 [Usitatibacter sp.]|nr:hypothetical protein [Usitatibacter sp.]